jgi:flagellar export protein FliJ
MGYHFKLEALRQYRNFQEDIKKKELALAQRDRDLELEYLNALIDKRNQLEQDLKSKQQNSTNGPHMALYNQYLKRISAEITAQRQKLEDAETRCKDKMGDLLQAMQHRKTIEKLKEKDLHTYLKSLNQTEQKLINEIAIHQFARNHI